MASVSWRPGVVSLELAMARYRRWGPDPVNVFQDGTYTRVASGGTAYSAREAEDSIQVTAEDNTGALKDLQYRLAEFLSFEPVAELAGRDPYVDGLTQEFEGYRPPMVVDPLETLVGAISAQQVNLRWANTTRARLVRRFGQRREWLGTEVWKFPSAERLADVRPEELRRLQFTGAKSEAIVGLAKATAAGELDGLHSLPNADVIDRITSLRGIGRWTADWLLARCLGRPDVVAAGDLGVRKAVSFLYRTEDELMSEEAIREVADEWGDAANWTAHLLLERLARS